MKAQRLDRFIFLSVTIIAIFNSCWHESSETETVIQFGKPSDQPFIESVFDGVEILPLSGEFLLGDFTSIKYKNFNDSFIIFDGRQTVLLFDLNGNLISRINYVGNGPGEYFNISDAIVSEGNLILLCDNEKIITCSLSGEYVNEYKLPFAAERIMERKGSGYMFFVPRTEVDVFDNNRIVLTDKEFVVEDSFLPFEPSIMSYNSTTLTPLSNGSVLCSQYFDPIYVLADGVVEHTYRLEFGNKEMPKEYVEAMSMGDAMQMLPDIQAYFLVSAMMNEKYLLMDVAYQDGFECNEGANWLYDLKDKTSSISSYDVREELFGVIGHPLYLSEANQIYYLVDCDPLKETESIPSIMSEIKDSIDDGIHYMILIFNITTDAINICLKV